MKSARPMILIVDDAPANIHRMGRVLMTDYEVTIATSGAEALEIVRRNGPPDLILLDILMPGMDGYEVCRRLKQDEPTSNVPVIFITAKTDEEDERAGLEVGAVDYITKPVSMPIVEARIRTHLELKRHRDILEELSMRDGLTGIPNRRHFDDHFGRSWRYAVRDGTALSLIMIDIDCFKAFNDTYGHLAGDDCLREVSRAITAFMRRPLDFACRYGGEEFVCVLPNTGSEGVGHIAGLIQEAVCALEIPHQTSPVAACVTVSSGVATAKPTREDNPAALVEQADQALYEAKAEGRNRVARLPRGS